MPRLPRAAAAVLVTVMAALALPTAASAAPAPFGHACTPTGDVRTCPTAELADRVPSWDGTPLDVDVTLPAEGDGPFPTVLLLHGLGGDKTMFQGAGAYSAAGLARRGYAVVTPTARGFGRSCGKPETRTAGCEQGWVRLADMRYEVRDLQHLTGLLVDQGIAKADAIGATGVSYGGGMSTMLAYLKDRVRLPDGGFAPWTSANGAPIELAAAWPRWMWTNGESIFTRNGRGAWSRKPVGVNVLSYANGIFAVPTIAGWVAPTGGDLSTDLTLWKRLLDTGVTTPEAERVLDNSYDFHGVAGLSGTPAPLLMESGWNDALFPTTQAIAAYEDQPKADISLQLADVGHAPGANKAQDVARIVADGTAFLDEHLRGVGSGPEPRSVLAMRTTCPKAASSSGTPYTAARLDRLARGTRTLRGRKALRITSKGGDEALAKALDPLSRTGGDLCTAHEPDRRSKAVLEARAKGETLLGQPIVTGTVRAKGRNGQLVARLWDRDPRKGTQRLVTRGAYRLTTSQKGRFTFELDGNGWRFAKGHRIVLELLGRDAPTYGASPNAFSATVSNLRVSLPTR